MIQLMVVSLHGAPLDPPLVGEFGPGGGSIGRAIQNTLVLDDPERTVSRVHAQVVYRNGMFFISDQGSNPTQHNGLSLGRGLETALAPGDRLLIGGFELRVRECAPAMAPLPGLDTGEMAPAPDVLEEDPFSNLMEGLAPAPHRAPVAAPLPEEGPFPDPMGMNASATADQFDDLLGIGGASPLGAEPQTDDLSRLVAPARNAKADSIDAFFGLGTPSVGDPLATTPLADPWLQPNTASAQDPLASLSHDPPLQPASRSDHLPVGQFGFMPPQAVPAGQEAKDGSLFLPQGAPGAGEGSDRGKPRPFARGAATSDAAPLPLHQAPEHELLAAFLRGLGPLQQSPTQLTPGLMERIGEMLRTSTEGTLQLLLTRQEFKKEVRAQATMIAAQANNPLKFSPTVEVALAHLLGPGMRGFMPAQAAMRDAYQDLRAHEFGVMVGMRAALAHVIERFEPAELEKNIAARSKLDAIFSAGRKAKLWDQFVALYGAIAKEAEDDFQSLFGKAFLKAYEEQLERLKTHDENSSGT